MYTMHNPVKKFYQDCFKTPLEVQGIPTGYLCLFYNMNHLELPFNALNRVGIDI